MDKRWGAFETELFKRNYWNEKCAFPQFQFLFLKENREPPTWFVEVLITAFIHDYEKVNDFEDLMRRWKDWDIPIYRNKAYKIFSQNEVALPYLSMGLNSIYKREGDISNKTFGIDIYEPYLNDYETQKRQSEGQNLTIAEYVTKKVDLSSMLRRSYSRALHALSLFRKDRPNEYPAFTQEDVRRFLEKVFKNEKNKVERNEHSWKDFFLAIGQFEKNKSKDTDNNLSFNLNFMSCSKEQVFIEIAVDCIKSLNGYSEYLGDFKGFVHDINKFTEFAKIHESLIMPHGANQDALDH